MQEMFDRPEEYERMLSRGIGLAGDDRRYYILGRLGRVESCLSQPPHRVLDFGCGTGDTAAELARRFPDAGVWGTDPALPALAHARREFPLPNLRFFSPAELAGEVFDLIYLNGVIHHIDPGERDETVRSLYARTAPGGCIWIFENNPANPGTRWAMYANPFDKGVVKESPPVLKRRLEKAGFSILRCDFLFFFPRWLSWFRFLEPRLLGFPLGGQYGILACRPPDS